MSKAKAMYIYFSSVANNKEYIQQNACILTKQYYYSYDTKILSPFFGNTYKHFAQAERSFLNANVLCRKIN